MHQIARIWASLSRAQQISLVLIPALLIAAAYGFARWKHDSGFRTLYSGLAPEDASVVVQKIREAGIEYKLDETGASVLVPADRIADARLALAGAGLPKTGRIGFEIFDRNNLGASDFAEQVNYRRALEGELERTVATLSEVEQARIHITFAKESVFLDARQPSKATVVLKLKRNAELRQGSVNAVANLVAGAVDGLGPESVAIIDSGGHLLNRPRAAGDNDAALAETNLEYRRQVESELLTKINLALGPLLGPDRFRASVNVDCDFSSSEQSEEIVDGDKVAILTTQSTEESSGGLSAGGAPGAASNLPRPPVRTAGTGTGLVRRTENTAYQPSRTVRKTVQPKGSVRRISTAILLDQTVLWQGIGPAAKKTLVPPGAETLKGVHDIIAGITGFTEQRGDQITVETLPFESTVAAEPPSAVVPPGKPVAVPFNFKQPGVIAGGAAAVFLLAALVFVFLRLGKQAPPATAVNTAPPALAAGALVKAGQTIEGSVLGTVEDQLAANESRQSRLEAETLSRIKMPEGSRKSDVLVKHLRESVASDATNATNVLRTWIADTESRRG